MTVPMHSPTRRSAIASIFALLLCGFAHAETLKRIEVSDFGKTKDGAAVKLITLRNAKGMSAQILTYGAIIKVLNVPDRDGKIANVVLTTDSIEKYERFNGAAAVIGRVANRIAGAQL